MEPIPAEAVQWKPAEPAENFSGQAWFGRISHHPPHVNALGVLFEPGSMTAWHTHPEGQVLYVLSGVGVVETTEERVEVGPGDAVHAPPGEIHRHGAAANGFMMHLSLTTGPATEWLGHDRPG